MSDRRQEWLNQIVAGFRAQNWAICGDERGCLYRGPNGTKCAVGHILSDYIATELDKDPMTVESMETYLLLPKLNLGPLTNLELTFLKEIQKTHDRLWGHDGAKLETKLREFAMEQGLTWP